ncbi:MAG: DUF2130 domain-containing protein [Chitinophagaceae bacterium]|nr:DUF2130 domain-containing protein [Chitinophagaceae bacterium]
MATDIKCPECGKIFDVEEVIAGDIEEKFKKEYSSKLQQSLNSLTEERKKLHQEQNIFEEKKKKENELFQQKLIQEKQKIEADLQQQLTRSITSDFEHKLKMLEQNNHDQEEKLKLARQKELEFMQKENQLKNKEAELEISIQRKLQEERVKLSEDIRAIEEQKIAARETEFQLRMRELESQLEVQKKLAAEMTRKAEQGSMQLQGETQELLLEEILREHFPFDSIVEVGKGVEGADCMQIVRNGVGTECGKIIFESKRAKSWNNIWVEKLKTDMRNKQADLAILVTQSFPKGMNCFGERDGVWICSFKEVTGLTTALRNAIIRIADTRKSEENKGEKMQMLYNYLTGIEFRQHIEAIVEGFMSMKISISKERVQMEKLWKEREKQLEKVLLNTSGMYGSIKGIAGSSVNTIPLLEGSDVNEDDMAH